MLVENTLSDSDLEKAVLAADSGEQIETAQPEDTRSSSSTDASEASTAATQAGAEETKEPVLSSSESPAAKQQDPAESKFKQAQKERERRERSWQALEEEKATFRKEREEFLAARRRLEEQSGNRREPGRDEHGYTAAEYEEYAAEQKELGNDSMAQRAEARARELRAREPQAEATGLQPVPQEAWMEQVQAAVAQLPELCDESNPLSQEVASLLQAEPIFSHDPQGFYKAVTVSRWKLDAARVPELLKQVETQKSEIEKLNRALSIGGSNPMKPGSPKPYEGMSEVEKDDFIARRAAEADDAG